MRRACNPRAHGASACTFPASAAVHYARWQALTQQADRAVGEERAGQARQSYEEALSEAGGVMSVALLFPTDDVTGLAPRLYDVSCQHVAELARQQKDELTEGIFLYRAYERLVQDAELVDAPLALRVACVRQLPVALAALVGYLADRGPSGPASVHTQRARSAAVEVLRVAAAQDRATATGVRQVMF